MRTLLKMSLDLAGVSAGAVIMLFAVSLAQGNMVSAKYLVISTWYMCISVNSNTRIAVVPNHWVSEY